MSQEAKPARQPLKVRKKLVFSMAILGACLLATEFILQIAAAYSPRFARQVSYNRTERILDSMLGHRPNPEAYLHDETGFRNRTRPPKADVVAIGDSQTYAISVHRDEAWPQQLQEQTGHSVYNMAWGGYAPPRYLLLLKEALSLSPDWIVVGFYAGNDLANAYTSVYQRDLAPQLKTTNRKILDALEQASMHGADLHKPWFMTRQAIEAKRAEYERFVPFPAQALVDQFGDDLNLDGRGLARLDDVSIPAYGRIRLFNLVSSFGNTTDPRLGAMTVRNGRRADPWQACVQRAEAVPDALLFPADVSGCRTILTPASRLALVDTSDIRIAAGLWSSLQALIAMRDIAAPKSRVLVLFIPTKETVFYQAVQAARLDYPEELTKLAEAELRFWAKTKHRLDQAGVEWLESLGALRASIERGESPYYIDEDGHPNVVGNRVLAETVARRIQFGRDGKG